MELVKNGTERSVSRITAGRQKRAGSRSRRPRSAVTSGRQLFIDGDPNSAWTRRWTDLYLDHIADISAGQGPDVLSAAQLVLLRRATSIECELERMNSMLSRGEEIDLDSYARVSGHLRRMWETLGLKRQMKDVSAPSLDTYLEMKQRARREVAQEQQQAQEETAE